MINKRGTIDKIDSTREKDQWSGFEVKRFCFKEDANMHLEISLTTWTIQESRVN